MTEKKNIGSEMEKEIMELSPTLAKLSREHPYKVPEGYFDCANDHAAKMALEMGIQKPGVSGRLIYIRYAAVAASIVILAMLAWNNFFPRDQKHIAEASVDEMIEYLETESSNGIEEDVLVEELIEIEMMVAADEAIDEAFVETDEDELTTEEIIEYLPEDNIDLATIIDELN